MSNTIEITLKVTIPDQLDATSDEIEEFIEFELGTSASLSGNNPIIESDLAPEVEYGSARFRW